MTGREGTAIPPTALQHLMMGKQAETCCVTVVLNGDIKLKQL
jgi:hypothetical protein